MDNYDFERHYQFTPLVGTMSQPLTIPVAGSNPSDLVVGAFKSQHAAAFEAPAMAGLQDSLPTMASTQALGNRSIFVGADRAKPPGIRGPFKDQALREQTACTRQKGACIECQRQHIRVSFVIAAARKSTHHVSVRREPSGFWRPMLELR